MRYLRKSGLTALGFGACALWACGCGGSTDINVGIPGDGGSRPTDASAEVDASIDASADVSTACSVIRFARPLEGATLSDLDNMNPTKSDAAGAACEFKYDVEVITTAADGTPAKLMAGATQVATATVQAGAVTFAKAPLPIGSTTLKAMVGSGDCAGQSANITVKCAGAPTCKITKPDVSLPTHPILNGVPVAEGGDRVSAQGSEYQAAFEVTTGAEDGQLVLLRVGNSQTALSAAVAGGKATFPGVALSPDGKFDVEVTCTSKSGISSKAQGTYSVDSTAPALTLSSPSDGQHFGPEDDSDPNTDGLQFKVCGATTSSDALNLPASLGAGQKNFCVGIGSATPTCVAASGAQSCVNLTCSNRQSSVNVTLSDGAGNKTAKTIQNMTCTLSTPSVTIVDPTDGTGSDVKTHLLANGATAAGQRKDAVAATPGAQYTVTACTDVENATMVLKAGQKGQTLTQIATTAVAKTGGADGCPATEPFVGKFTNTTLPESVENADGSLQSATELKVEVSDQGTVGSSPAVDVWVDSVAPTISAYSPNPLCGKHYQSANDYVTSLGLSCAVVPIDVAITRNGMTSSTPLTTRVSGIPTGQVTFLVGVNEITATASEPSGNTGALSSPCTVTVGNPPVVTWVQPAAGTGLNLASDQGTASGWQGQVKACTDLAGISPTPTISFDLNGNTVGPLAIDAAGCAAADVTIADAHPATLTATTSDILARGVGTATMTTEVDTVAPDAIAAVTATVKDRRQTTFHLAWKAPADNGQRVYGYAVRASKLPIDASNFDNVLKVTYGGSPAAVGADDGIDVPDLLIENDYYFAVAPVDKAGNRGPITVSSQARASFNSLVLSSPYRAANPIDPTADAGTITYESFGYSVDGSTDLNGDGFSDLLVGVQGGTKAYIYFGQANGYSQTPSVTISGSASAFGYAVAVVGDINSDSLPDIVVTSPYQASAFVFPGRASWPATVSTADLTTIQIAGASLFGYSVQRVGDFDGDTIDDFAVGNNAGSVAVVRGVGKGMTMPSLIAVPGAFSAPIGDGGTGTQAIQILSSASTFSYTMLGLGRFYDGPNSLIVSAPTDGAGKLFAFGGVASGPVSDSNCLDSYAFTEGNRGGQTLGFIGAVGSRIGIVGGLLNDNLPGGPAYLFFGDKTTGPFHGSVARISDSAAIKADDSFGRCIVAGTFPGTSVTTSFLGGSDPDLVLSGNSENGAPSRVYFYTGAHAATIGDADVVTTADAIYALPVMSPAWLGAGLRSGAIKDMNGDGYGDIAISESTRRVSKYDGRVLVLW